MNNDVKKYSDIINGMVYKVINNRSGLKDSEKILRALMNISRAVNSGNFDSNEVERAIDTVKSYARERYNFSFDDNNDDKSNDDKFDLDGFIKDVKDRFNNRCDLLDEDMEDGKSISVGELEKIRREVIKIYNDGKISNADDKKRIDDLLKDMDDVISDYRKYSGTKDRGEGISIDWLDVVGEYADRIELEKGDIVKDYPNRGDFIDSILKNLKDNIVKYNDGKIKDPDLIDLIMDVRKKMLDEFNFDLNVKDRYVEQRDRNKDSSDLYKKIIEDVDRYSDLLDDNESFILHGDKDEDLEDKNEELDKIRERLFRIKDSATKKNRSADTLRKELDEIIKDIKDNYHIGIDEKGNSRVRRRKVVSVKRIGLGAGGIGLGIYGAWRIIATVMMHAKYGVMDNNSSLALTGSVSAAAVLLLVMAFKSANNDKERGIIKRLIDRIRDSKGKEEDEDFDYDDDRNIGGRKK